MKAQSVVRIVVVCPISLSAMTLARAGAEDVADLMKLMPADMPTSIVAVDVEKFALTGWKGGYDCVATLARRRCELLNTLSVEPRTRILIKIHPRIP